MKKMLFPMTALLLSFHLSAQPLYKSFAVDVSFGRHGSDCSSGRGICSFSVSKNNITAISWKSFRKISDNTIVLQIQRNALKKTEEVCIVGTPFSEMNPGETTFFIQMDDLILDSDSLQSLVIDKKRNVIAAGNYPMSIGKDGVEILFTLKDSNDVKP